MDYKTYEVQVYEDCDKFWHLNGQLHRKDGPAVEYANGDKAWYLNDKLHREDGPAIENVNGVKFWFLNGVEYTEEDFLAKTKPATCEGKIVEIDGKKYRLTEEK